MIQFVNAKINIGLNVIRRREDGYHLLETIFYPVGLHNGKAENPHPFCDILEAQRLPSTSVGNIYRFEGRRIECEDEDNLVCRAAELISERSGCHFAVTLSKHLPDGAGLGGGSADASFTLRLLASLLSDNDGCTGDKSADKERTHFSHDELMRLALSLGADCPFFINNTPSYGEGIGEILTPVANKLDGMWALIVKPSVYVSTREAFAGIQVRKPELNVREIYDMPIESWCTLMTNDFETTIFGRHPQLATVKRRLYECGAVYAQMSGSGAALYGLYANRQSAEKAAEEFADCQTYVCLL